MKRAPKKKMCAALPFVARVQVIVHVTAYMYIIMVPFNSKPDKAV